MKVYEKLAYIQKTLKVAKENYNSFGKYKYRSCEDILEGVKPLCAEVNAVLTLTDAIVQIGDRYYLKATASLFDIENGESVITDAYAREDLEKKGMDLAQVTGSVSSYARKYALNGLFCIDDTKDSDATNKHGQDEPQFPMAQEKVYACEGCGEEFTPFEWKGKNYTAKDGYEIAKKKYGKALCKNCREE